MAALGACGIPDAAVDFGETHPAEQSKAVGRRNSLLAPQDAQNCVPLSLLLHCLGCPLPTSLGTLHFGQQEKSLIASAQCSQVVFMVFWVTRSAARHTTEQTTARGCTDSKTSWAVGCGLCALGNNFGFCFIHAHILQLHLDFKGFQPLLKSHQSQLVHEKL